MKILTAEQIREIDEATIKGEPISSVNLMERAANQLLQVVLHQFTQAKNIALLAGPGNNGGDAIALTRLLSENGKRTTLFLIDLGGQLSPDSKANLNRLDNYKEVTIETISKNDASPDFQEYDLLIDGIFGSGLSRPVEGWLATLFSAINQSASKIMSIDIPSGLFSEDNTENNGAIIKAAYTVSFEFPKLAFLLPENEPYVGEWEVRSINLLPQAIDKQTTSNYCTTIDRLPELQKRSKFAHKGHFGHALLIAGSYGKTGAALLAAKACLRSGVGLLTVHVPQSAYEILQSTVPEAMALIDETEQIYCSAGNIEKFDFVGAGPGIGQKKSMVDALRTTLSHAKKSMVLDADALNIIAAHQELFKLIPENSILTPHPKEFDRLTHTHTSQLQRIESAKKLAKQHNIIIILKGAHTAIINSNGQAFFNTTGSPAMAKGGSGDVLTGMVLGILSSGYRPINAAILATFLHGKAAELALANESVESVIATDIIEQIGAAFEFVRKNKQ
ncbi:MAG: NAD(P)H-hydrate dehydratase [Salinivirgaceae bacterium]